MDGATGLVLLVPAIDPAVQRWRRQYDPVAGYGMPAHVTVCYPWQSIVEVGTEDRAALSEIAAATRPVELTFARFGRFDETLWLDPQPSDLIVALTDRIVARWPGFPPYGGAFDEVVPHLTLADGSGDRAFAAVHAALEPLLPLHARIPALTLMVLADDRWAVESQYPFGAPGRKATGAQPDIAT